MILGCGVQPSHGTEKGRKMADEIPADVRAYLLAGDGLGRVSVIREYPSVETRITRPEVQATLYRYLASREPWNEEIPSLAMAALDTLLATPTEEGAKSVRALKGHPNALLRIRAYRYLFAVVYPRDRVGMLGVIEEMLYDRDDAVRLEAARLAKNLRLAPALHGVLQNWMRVAPERQWNRGESYAILEDLAK
jgi:hypothetical protein